MMVSKGEKKQIEEMMESINEAKKNDRSEKEIERRAQELYNYLEEIGAIE